MTDEPRGTDWKARLSSAAAPIRAWWRRRSMVALAESTVARALAGLAVTAGTIGGVASIPDVLDGRDVQATTIERAAADLDAVLDRVAELEAETAVLADASAALLASVREQAAILDGVTDTATVEALRQAVQEQADALARRLSTLAANVADIDLIGAPADTGTLDDLAASLTSVADGLAGAAQDAASAAQVAEGAVALAETTAADLSDLSAAVDVIAADVVTLAADAVAAAAERDRLASDVAVHGLHLGHLEELANGNADRIDALDGRVTDVEALQPTTAGQATTLTAPAGGQRVEVSTTATVTAAQFLAEVYARVSEGPCKATIWIDGAPTTGGQDVVESDTALVARSRARAATGEHTVMLTLQAYGEFDCVATVAGARIIPIG